MIGKKKDKKDVNQGKGEAASSQAAKPQGAKATGGTPVDRKEGSPEVKRKGPGLALIISILVGLGSAVSLFLYRQDAPSIFAGYFHHYEMLLVFGLVALSALTWGFFQQKKIVGVVILILFLAVVACQVLRFMPVVAVYGFLVDLLGLLPMMITKLLGFLVGLAGPPQVVSDLASWVCGVLVSPLYALVPKIIYA